MLVLKESGRVGLQRNRFNEREGNLIIAPRRPPPLLEKWEVGAKEGRGMRAASSTNERARMLGPASHMCQSANQGPGMLGHSIPHVSGSQSGGEGGVVLTLWPKVCGITPFGKPGHSDLLKHILPRDLRQIEISMIPSAWILSTLQNMGVESTPWIGC